MSGRSVPQQEDGAVVPSKSCQQSGGLGKFFACVTPRPKPRQGMAAAAGKDEEGSADGRRDSVASHATSASAARVSIGRRLSVASRGTRAEDHFCRDCGARLGKKTRKCESCGADRRASGAGSEASGSAAPSGFRFSVSRQGRARRATLNKYMAVVQKHEGRRRIKTMDAAFRARLNDARRTFHQTETTRRLARAHTLREDFFKSAKAEAGAMSPSSSSNFVFEELDRSEETQRRSKRGQSTSSEAPFKLDLVDVPQEQEDFYLKDVDQFLAASIKELEANKKALLKSEKQLHLNKIKQIKQLRNNLLSEQDAMIAEVRTQSKAVIKGLRKHAEELTANIKRKAKEGDELDAERQEQIAELDAVVAAFSSITLADDAAAAATASSPSSRGGAADRARRGPRGSEGDFDRVFERERQRKENANMLLQQNFESRLEQLQEELATTEGHLNDLELEQYFPKIMQWKVRLNSGDGLFIGMRDLDLEMLDANIVMGRGDELGTVLFEVRDIRAIVGIYQFSINGNTATAKLLRGLLTPTVNRLDLEVSGNWNLKLRFKPGGEHGDLRPKWVKEESQFDLHLTKETAGAGLILLPDRVIRWLTTQLLPSVISSSIMLNLPIRLGNFFQHPQNFVRLSGKLHVEGQIPPRVWCAPLVGPTMSAKLARKAMGLTDEEAVLLDLMFRSDLATYAGFHKKAISMARLYKWRLQYASQPLAKLAVMLGLIESNPHVLLQHGEAGSGEAPEQPNGWALQIVNRVCELAVKPVTLDLQILEIDADVNVKQAMDIFTGMYIESLEHEVEKATGSRAIRAAERKVEHAKERAARFEGYLEAYIAPILSDKVSFDFTTTVMGGLVSGIMMASMHKLEAQLKLPSVFEWNQVFGEAFELSKGFNLTIQGETGPGQGEYTLKAKHKWVDPSEAPLPQDVIPDDDAQAIIKDLSLNLFPSLLAPGTVRLTAESLKASWFICSLAEALGDGRELEHGSAGPGSHQRAASTLVEAPAHALPDGATNGSVEELLLRSRSIMADLWARYYTSRAVVQTERQHGQHGHGGRGGAAAEGEGAVDAQNLPTEHPYLPRIFTDEQYDLQIDLRGVQVQAIREIGVDQKSTIRVTLGKSKSAQGGHVPCLAALHVRFSLAEIFESGEPV